MLRPFRFKTNEKQKVHVVTDTHFHHEKDFLFKGRGYASSPEHDEHVIQTWNERVAPNDIVIHLGDFIFNATHKLAIEYIERLNGKIFLLWGNHNSGVKQLYNLLVNQTIGCDKKGLSEEYFAKTAPRYEIYPITWKDQLTFCGHYMYGSVDKVDFVASHFAFRTWDSMQRGAVHICGHSHSNDVESNSDFKLCKRLDVSIEKFGGPVEWSEIIKIMDTKQVQQTDHHDTNTTSSSF